MTQSSAAWPVHPQHGVHDQAARTPPRRPESLRRTTALDFYWPGDLLGPSAVLGTGRDLLTGSRGAVVLATAFVRAILSPPGAVVTAIEWDVDDLDLSALRGVSVSTGFRKNLYAVIPRERRHGMHYRLLHDLPGAAMVSQSVPIYAGHKLYEPEELLVMADVCRGWRSGGYQTTEISAGRHPMPIGPVPNDLDDGSDPLAWHEADALPGDTFRRGRRMDVWRLGDDLFVDLHYRDVYRPTARTAMVVHEYSVRARADVDSMLIREVQTQAHALPWTDCNSVVSSSDELLGVPLGECDAAVRSRLRGTAGCTHLNDSLRELDEVPALVTALVKNLPVINEQ